MSKSRTKTPNLRLTQPEPMSFWPNVAEMAPIRADITKNMLHPPKMPDNTVRTWFAHGSHMVRTWFAHGSHMVRTWFAHGSHMVRAWFGPLFAKIWNEISQKSKNVQNLTECASQQGNFKRNQEKKTTFWEFNRALSDARASAIQNFSLHSSRKGKSNTHRLFALWGRCRTQTYVPFDKHNRTQNSTENTRNITFQNYDWYMHRKNDNIYVTA